MKWQPRIKRYTDREARRRRRADGQPDIHDRLSLARLMGVIECDEVYTDSERESLREEEEGPWKGWEPPEDT